MYKKYHSFASKLFMAPHFLNGKCKTHDLKMEGPPSMSFSFISTLLNLTVFLPIYLLLQTCFIGQVV